MPRKDPFRATRFPKDVILLAVWWDCRYPLFHRDVGYACRTRDQSAHAAREFLRQASERVYLYQQLTIVTD